MAQAQLMGLGGGSGSSKKKKNTDTREFSLLRPVVGPSKLTPENMAKNITSHDKKLYNSGQGPTIENAKKLTNKNTSSKNTSSSGGGGGVKVVSPKVSSTKTTNTQKSLEAKQKEHEKTFREKFEKQIQNELDRYEKQLRDELERNEKGIHDEISRLEASGRAAIDRNNEYLSQQLSQLQDQRVVADQDTINLMNRRGAFYSGGTDYYLAQNQRATQEASGNLQSEIGSRNAEIEQGNQMARERALSQITMSRDQAMSTLTMLREQAPDKVRQLVDEALERQWAKDFQMEQFNWQKSVQQQEMQFRQAQAAAAASRAAASQALANQRWQAQQKQQQWENQMAERQFELQASNANTQTVPQNDIASYNSFLMNMNSFQDPQEGYRVIQSYIDRGGSQETASDMIKAMQSRYSY